MTHSSYSWQYSFTLDMPVCGMTHSIRDTTHIFMWRDSYICNETNSCMTWLIHTWHDSLKCPVMPLDHAGMWHDSSSMRHDSYIRDMTHCSALSRPSVTWLRSMWHDSFIRDMTFSPVIWLLHMWHDSCILIIMRAPWLLYWFPHAHLIIWPLTIFFPPSTSKESNLRRP